jgi:sugar phosphate permease
MSNTLEMGMSPEFRRKRTLIFIVVAIGYLVVYFQRVAPAVVGPVIVDDLGFAMTDIGLMASMYFWAQGAGCLPAGLLTDYFGARKLMTFSLIATAAGTAIFAVGTGLGTLAFGRFVIGLSVSVIYIGAMKIFSVWYRPNELATVSGVLLALGNIGALLSTRPLVALMTAIGWRNAFWCITAYTFIAAILIWLYAANRPQDKGFAPVQEEPEAESAVEKISMKKALGAVFRLRDFYLLGVLSACFYGTLMSVGGLWATSYLEHVYGMSKDTAASIVMLFPLGMIIGCPLGGYLSDKILRSRKTAILLGAIVNFCLYIPLVFFTDAMTQMQFYIFFFIFGVSGGFFILCVPAVKEIVEPKYTATAIGANNAIGALGVAFFQYACGVIIDLYDKLPSGTYGVDAYHGMFLFCMCSLLVGIVAMFLFREKGKL